ncbi:MAG TPA: hypothetical protein VKP30_17565, partial [Polyangiaceae bacterium]|nr:hypothetical protein [Polyangiaceae bacterium]
MGQANTSESKGLAFTSTPDRVGTSTLLTALPASVELLATGAAPLDSPLAPGVVDTLLAPI